MSIENLQKIEKNFLRDVQDHTLEVVEKGLLRYLKFRNKNGSSKHHFNITTWPGYLAISGDMGHFVFRKEPDMFKFFRGKIDSVGYITEKLIAEDLNRARVFSQEVLINSLKEIARQYHQYYDAKEVRELEEDLLDRIGESETEEEAVDALIQYEYEIGDGSEHVNFEATDLPTYTDYSHQYLTCLVAIAWGYLQLL